MEGNLSARRFRLPYFTMAIKRVDYAIQSGIVFFPSEKRITGVTWQSGIHHIGRAGLGMNDLPLGEGRLINGGHR